MIIGRYICERCGCDCTPPNHLWGFGLMIRGAVNSNQQKDLEAIKKVFGKNEFVWCWRCVAEIFGVKPLVEKQAEQDKPDLPEPKKPIPANTGAGEGRGKFFRENSEDAGGITQ